MASTAFLWTSKDDCVLVAVENWREVQSNRLVGERVVDLRFNGGKGWALVRTSIERALQEEQVTAREAVERASSVTAVLVLLAIIVEAEPTSGGLRIKAQEKPVARDGKPGAALCG